jgi:hypothetical protein
MSHFEHQFGSVLTSYNPFDFSQVANDHDLSRQACGRLGQNPLEGMTFIVGHGAADYHS